MGLAGYCWYIKGVICIVVLFMKLTEKGVKINESEECERVFQGRKIVDRGVILTVLMNVKYSVVYNDVFYQFECV